MKREILFRGKRVTNGEWVEGEIHEGSDYVQIFEKPKDQRLYGKVYYVHPETVGQYTGLTDKNGTKIFEGDIIRNHQAGENEVFWYPEDASFCYRNYHAGALPLGDTCMATMEGELFTNHEVIGNTHDNPELLNK